jgi:hypothetical protein
VYPAIPSGRKQNLAGGDLTPEFRVNAVPNQLDPHREKLEKLRRDVRALEHISE